MSKNSLINYIIGRDSGSESSQVRKTLEFNRYLYILLVKVPSTKDDFNNLE